MSAGGTQRIAVIDFGLGNLHSVVRALQWVADDARIAVTRKPGEVEAAHRVVFPGQGAIGVCRRELERLGLLSVVARAAREKPFFGMCLGPQFLMDHSEEDGGVAGLGIVPGDVRRFPEPRGEAGGERFKVPHMGWNRAHRARSHQLWNGIPEDAWFYFVHSYYLRPAREDMVMATTQHGLEFASAIARENVFAVQFHPEKSAEHGLRLLQNFLRWDPA